MPVSKRQFIENLERAEMLTQQQVTQRLSELPKDQQPIDGETLAALLIKDGVLTSFQADRLNRERPKNLRCGNYQIQDILGQGGMGTVYKASHLMMKHDVAIKIMSQKKDDETNSRFKRFQREVQAAGKLSHHNIVSALDAGEEEGEFFLVMELVHGDDLGKISKCEGELPVEEVLDYMSQTAVGLKYAHDEGVVHRDIKPHNLLLSSDRTIKILDLGLVSLQRSDDSAEDSLTGQNQIIGTVDYMSPEQAKDVHNVDGRADIYSLGCTMFRLLTGTVAYPGTTTIERLLAHRDKPIPSLHDHRSDIPELLDRIFRRMVAKDPEDRYQSMDEVIEALETCRLASVTTIPVIQTDDTSITTIEEFTLDLAGEEISTVEVERQELDSINVTAPNLPPELEAAPKIDSGNISGQIPEALRMGKSNYIVTLLTLLILVSGAAVYWWVNRPPRNVEVNFPLEYREGRWAIEIFDHNNRKVIHLTERNADGYEDINPITFALGSGKYTYALMRPPFFPNTGRFEMEPGKMILVDGSIWETSDLQELGLIDNELPEQTGENASNELVEDEKETPE
ncbi:MAG: serine/threonine-protein kinase [Planctomycetota bacterium]|nr:serine/threonine-protein kinase [Planctomycetota bacterium]